jgi:hydrogenase-4 component B
MGLYGLLRVLTFLGAPGPWWGLLLASLGLLTALVGISLAVQQRDTKRVLAYSSIENMGLIGVALGVSLWCAASAMPAAAAMAMAAGLLHIWNHALMKGMMFLAAGSVLHATGTKDMEKLGGLMKRMPWTGTAMMLGAAALSALPPLNGFVSEWLLYLSLMKCGLTTTGGPGLTAFLTVGLVALVGGLAAITFVRLAGVVLLGSPRSEAAARAHESSRWMLAPMVILVLLCLTVAVIPKTVTGLLPGPMDQILGAGAGQAFLMMERSEAPLGTLGYLNGWTLIALGTTAAFSLALSRSSSRTDGPTWGCGYRMPTVRMQYTGRSFAQMIAENALPRLVRVRTTFLAPRGLFPSRSQFGAHCADPVSERLYKPAFRHWADRCARLRILQQGNVHVYLVYMVLTVVLALAWVSIRR